MPSYDFKAQRLFVPDDLAAGIAVAPDKAQTHYLVNVLRLGPGDAVLLFNGRDGEWLARLAEVGKKHCRLEPVECTRPQPEPADLVYAFAPLKHARLDYMVQKAVEMGVSRLQPVFTRHAQPGRVNLDRMRANAIEAAEQCGILSVPEIGEPLRFSAFLDGWDPARRLIFCNERAEGSPLAALARLKPGPLGLVIGPEGGFSDEERAALAARPFVTPVALGPRILRADTAAVAALALFQAALGDWR